MRLITHFEGEINGVAIEGKGVGSSRDGITEGEMVFTRFPSTFAAPLCRSWKCVHHQENLPLEKPVEIRETIAYTSQSRGTIEKSARVVRHSPELQEAWNIFRGTYDGSLELVRSRVHRETRINLGKGRALVLGYRQVDTDKGNMDYEWSGFEGLPEGQPVPTQTVNFEWLEWEWKFRNGGASYRKKLRVSFAPVPDFVVRPARERELDEILAAYDADWERLAHLYGQRPEGPRMTQMAFRRFQDERNFALLVAEHEGKLCGFAVGEKCENTDFLPGPYGEVVWLAPIHPWRASGVEWSLLEGLKGWFREQKLSVLQTTVYAWDPYSNHLFEAAGLRPAAFSLRGHW